MRFLRSSLKFLRSPAGKTVGKGALLTGAAASPVLAYKAYKAIDDPSVPNNYTGYMASNVLAGKIRTDELSDYDYNKVMDVMKMKKIAALPISDSGSEIEKSAYIMAAIPRVVGVATNFFKTMPKGVGKAGKLGMTGLTGAYYAGEFSTARKGLGQAATNMRTSTSLGNSGIANTYQNQNFLTRGGTAVRSNFY